MRALAAAAMKALLFARQTPAIQAQARAFRRDQQLAEALLARLAGETSPAQVGGQAGRGPGCAV